MSASPRSLSCTSYALTRNRETVAIDALGEGDILILPGVAATIAQPTFLRISFRTDLLSTRKCLNPGLP